MSSNIFNNTPYGIKVKNTTDVVKKVILFGTNRNYHKLNFGNDQGIEIENFVSADSDYAQLLMQLSAEKFKVGAFRFTTTDLQNFTKHENSIDFKRTDANGREYETKIYFRELLSFHKNRVQKNILEIQYPITLNDVEYVGLTIDAKLQIELQLEPKSEMCFFVFPELSETKN